MLFLCYYRRSQHEDSALRLYELLCAVFGRQQVFDANTPPQIGVAYTDELESNLRRSDVVVVVIAPDWLDALDPAGGGRVDDGLRMALEAALTANKTIIPVLVDGATMPTVDQLPPALQGIARRQAVEIPADGGDGMAFRALVDVLERRGLGRSVQASARPAAASAPATRDGAAATRPAQPSPSPSYRTSPMAGGAHTSPAPSAPSPLPRRQGMFEGILTGLRTLWSAKTSEPSARQVLLAASAPRTSSSGAEFTAALVAYVEEARASAHEKLADLGEPGDRRVDDVAASAWRIGAPVTVRLTGEGATVTPPEVRFDWSGHENLAAFSVKVGSTPRDAVLLRFQILVADVPVAFLPMRVGLTASPETEATHRVQGALPRSAFASYSSRDAEPVTQRLSTLSRWAPGLDIFQDCLDLTPGESFKPQLENQIARRDVFILFWSREAALSPWVRWEYTTALQRKGLAGILPMPLEDPAIAPPPPELADQHQRDRFMLAGYGLAKVREEAGRGRSDPG